MKMLKHLSLFVLLAVLALASCKKDEVFETNIEPPIVEPTQKRVNGLIDRSFGGGDGLELICITVIYPFEFTMEDNSTVEINSEEDFLNSTSDPANPPIDFVYPLDVADKDGNELTVSNIDELAELFTDCIPNTGWTEEFPEWFFPAWLISYDNSCYQLIYPVTLLDVDSVSVIAADEDELISLLSDGNIYSYAFPLDLEDEDGETVTADDADELFGLLAECGPGIGNGGCGIGTFACYELGYPATLLLVDGTTVVVNDDDEFAEVLMSGEWAGFEYPLTLIDEEGNEVVVNNEDELHEAMMDCDPVWGGGGGGPGINLIFGCYELGYPAIIQLVDGSTIEINSNEEFLDALNTGQWAGFGYPMTLIDEDGNELIVNNEEELNEALEACDDWGTGGGNHGFEGDFFCYDFVYPFSITNVSAGTQVTFNNAAEWENFQYGSPAGPPVFEFVYPLTIVEVDSGEEVTVNSQQELFEAIEECW